MHSIKMSLQFAERSANIKYICAFSCVASLATVISLTCLLHQFAVSPKEKMTMCHTSVT